MKTELPRIPFPKKEMVHLARTIRRLAGWTRANVPGSRDGGPGAVFRSPPWGSVPVLTTTGSNELGGGANLFQMR